MSEPREAVGGGRTGERRGEVRTGDRVRWTGVRGGSVSTLVIDQSATQGGVWTSCDNKNFRTQIWQFSREKGEISKMFD